MFGAASIASIRYCDMLAGSDCAAHEQRHLRGVAREVERGLPGRVAAADDVDVAAPRERRAPRTTDAP